MNTSDTTTTASAQPENVRGKFKLICMSFDGEYQVERPTFDTLDEVANYANDLGSKWYFYPFTFAVTASAKTIADSVFPLDWAKGKRVKTVAKIFKTASEKPENANMDAEQYAFAV